MRATGNFILVILEPLLLLVHAFIQWGQTVYIFFLILLLGQEFAQFLIKRVIAYANYWLKLKKKQQ
jgi:hypothetical protein